MNKKAYIKTYGCQMNVYDSEKMMNILQKMDYDIIEDFHDADLVIINTCHIREKATEKVYSELGRINKEKIKMAKNGRDMVIIMSGCVAQAEGELVFARAKYVDIVVGPESYHKLPAMINKVKEGTTNLINIDFIADEKFDSLPEEKDTSTKASAFVTIQEGCDKFCAFCVVPYTRGSEFSRKVEAIIDEVKSKVDNGTKEIILLGQNVNAFHGVGSNGKPWKLSELISKISEINGLERIRYTTSHPNDMSEDLILMHGYERKLMPVLNLPVQSGSDNILKKMNRRHVREKYFDIMDNLRKNRPDIIFSSDFIVGFPGETEQDFEDTIDLVRRVKFQSQSFSFKYSQRPGTPAASDIQVDEDIKSVRLKKLQDLLESQVAEFNKTMLGKTVPVLFEDKKARNEGQMIGRTEFMQIVLCDMNESCINQIKNVKITQVNSNSLFGEVVM